jgi:hypothetical protein
MSASMAVRSRASRAGGVVLRDRTPGDTVGFAADPISTKGQQLIHSSSLNYFVRLRATLPDDPDTIAVKRVGLAVSRRCEWILIGSNPGNAKFVLLARAISQYSP